MTTSTDASGGSRRTNEFTTLEPIRVTVPESDHSAAAAFVTRVLPVPDPTAPVLLMLPAIAMKAKFYLSVLKGLHAAGLSAATVDLRAQGESTPALGEARDFGYREMLDQDLPAIITAVRRRFPRAPLFLFGHSLGGQLSLLYAAGATDGLSGVITIGTGSVYWRSFEPKRQLSVLLGSQYVSVVSRLKGVWPGGKVMGGPMAAGVMVDWAAHARTGRYRPRGATRDYDRLLTELPLRVLIISLDDDRMGPKSSVDYLAGRLRSADLTRWHLDASSGIRRRDHFAWVKDGDVLGALLAEWVRR